MRRLQKDMNTMFSNYFNAAPQTQARLEGPQHSTTGKEVATPLDGPVLANWSPKVDISENDKALNVHAELPGIKKEDIKLEVHNNTLTISGERKHEKKEDTEKYHRFERSYGKFSRSFSLPQGVDPATVQATYADGVLNVSIPKPVQAAAPKKIDIK